MDNKSANIAKATRKHLEQYSSKELDEKLQANKLMGLSKEIALQIIEDRKVPIIEKKEESKTQRIGKSKQTKMAKKSNVELIDETQPKVQAIISNTELNKTQKAQELLKLGYTPNQISKTSLDIHPSFCYTIQSKLKKS